MTVEGLGRNFRVCKKLPSLSSAW